MTDHIQTWSNNVTATRLREREKERVILQNELHIFWEEQLTELHKILSKTHAQDRVDIDVPFLMHKGTKRRVNNMSKFFLR